LVVAIVRAEGELELKNRAIVDAIHVDVRHRGRTAHALILTPSAARTNGWRVWPRMMLRASLT